MENFVISNTDFVQIKLLKINSVIYLPLNKKANKMNGEEKGNRDARNDWKRISNCEATSMVICSNISNFQAILVMLIKFHHFSVAILKIWSIILSTLTALECKS